MEKWGEATFGQILTHHASFAHAPQINVSPVFTAYLTLTNCTERETSAMVLNGAVATEMYPRNQSTEYNRMYWRIRSDLTAEQQQITDSILI